MVHNGDSATNVVDKMGTYPEITKALLDSLPAYGKDDYDAAVAYRDSLIDERKNTSTESVGAAPEGFTGPGMCALWRFLRLMPTGSGLRSLLPMLTALH